MIISTLVPDLGPLAYIMCDVYREEDALHGLAYQRRAGVLRLAQVVSDLDEDGAYEMAAAPVGGVGEA